VRDRVLGDLNEDGLARLEYVLDPLRLPLETGDIEVDLTGIEHGIPAAADVDEGRLHRGNTFCTLPR
jgi:hypothetical protein